MRIFETTQIECSFNSFSFIQKQIAAAKLQPYYDDDREPIMDTDEMDSEEDIILVGNGKKLEYHD